MQHEWKMSTGGINMAKVLHTATILHAGWDMDNEAKIVELEDGKREALTTSHGVECSWTREMAEKKLTETEASAASIRKALELWPDSEKYST
jgi:hypothetical protein